jgi:hypothetical protein
VLLSLCNNLSVCDKQFNCLILGLFSTLIIYKVCILVQLIELLQFLIVRFHGESPMEEEMCLMDSCTIISILRETIFLDPDSEVQKCFHHC